MKTRKIFSLIILLVLCPCICRFCPECQFFRRMENKQGKINCSWITSWSLSKITIQLKADSLLTTRVYENGMGEEFPL